VIAHARIAAEASFNHGFIVIVLRGLFLVAADDPKAVNGHPSDSLWFEARRVS
jgi:hypothetical protein